MGDMDSKVKKEQRDVELGKFMTLQGSFSTSRALVENENGYLTGSFLSKNSLEIITKVIIAEVL